MTLGTAAPRTITWHLCQFHRAAVWLVPAVERLGEKEGGKAGSCQRPGAGKRVYENNINDNKK